MSHFQKRIALLKYPPFFTYMIGFLFAAIGNGLGYIAMSWIVISKHSHVSAMAILMACFWCPNIILGPFMGVLADRLPRKIIMIISNLARGLIFIFFSFYLTHHLNVMTVYFMMTCIGISFSAFYASVFAFMRELVPENSLMHANSTVDIIYEMGNVFGMGFAGLLIAWTSNETAILLNGIAFLIATICMCCIPKKALCHGTKNPRQKIQLWTDFKAGLSYLGAQKELMIIYTIQLLIFITFLTTPLLLAPFSKTILHATVKQFGMIEAAASVGIVIGGLFMPWIGEKVGLVRTVLFFSCILCITFLFFGYNRSIPHAIGFYFLIGFSGAVWPLIVTKAQALTEIDFQGRVQSTFNSLSGITMLIFYFSVGLMGQFFGVQHLYLLEVVITVIAIVFLLRAKRILN